MLTAFLYDVAIAIVTFWMALYLRVETFSSPFFLEKNVHFLFVTNTLVLTISFMLNGLYYGIWRFSSIFDLVRVLKASFFGILASFFLNYLMHRMDSVPRSLMPIQFLLLVCGLGGGRFFYRFWKDYLAQKTQDVKKTQKVLIIGAGRAGERLCKEIMVNPDLNLKVVGFLDDDKNKLNRSIYNVSILGPVKDAKLWLAKLGAKKIYIAIPSCSSQALKEIKACLDIEKIELKILPRMDHLLNPRGELSLLRNISIEDLLGREQVQLDESGISELLGNRTIMITGAGGSIGSELCQQIARFNPREMILVDNSEFNLYELDQQFKRKFPKQKVILKIADIRNSNKLEQVFKDHSPAVLYHAAAYKHVPMMELNPEEAILTNILGTKTLATLAIKYNVMKFVMVSTDKAVNPTNIMGTSKRIAEMICNEFETKKTNTKFMSVRFGNVLGSSGSVIPLFRKQIEERRNITVTHPDIIRYFMSIPEASQLILQASLIGVGGEIFVLEMGEAVKIVDLAKEMIKLAGLKEGNDINIEFSGLRPGEKLYEELFSKGENFLSTAHGKIKKAISRENPANFETLVSQLVESAQNGEKLEKLALLLKLTVPELSHYALADEQRVVH